MEHHLLQHIHQEWVDILLLAELLDILLQVVLATTSPIQVNVLYHFLFASLRY